jgi:predicted lipoprotein with Yx(FWY)xxD motif
MRMTTVAFAAALAAASLGTASTADAATLTAKNGLTLYVFDKDVGGKPSCYLLCAVRWPPYLVKQGATMGTGWSKVQRTNGTVQWAYHGKPLYFFDGDTKKGDANGNGLGGVWHIVSG